ncbi:MAG: hypothetical protein U0941_11715 [Planctomycetaceae bacterium]
MDFTQGIIGPQGHVDALRHSLWLEMSQPGSKLSAIADHCLRDAGGSMYFVIPAKAGRSPIRIPPEEHRVDPNTKSS